MVVWSWSVLLLGVVIVKVGLEKGTELFDVVESELGRQSMEDRDGKYSRSGEEGKMILRPCRTLTRTSPKSRVM